MDDKAGELAKQLYEEFPDTAWTKRLDREFPRLKPEPATLSTAIDESSPPTTGAPAR
jgi:hypothetical protein